jgi:hypothetical protein
MIAEAHPWARPRATARLTGRAGGRYDGAAATGLVAVDGRPGRPRRNAMTSSRCTRGVRRALPALAVGLLLCAPALRATDTLPDRLDDAAFRALVERASEADGPFQSDNLASTS